MKKLLAMAVAMVFAFGANAQINKGEIIGTAGIGLGNSLYGAYSSSLLPINLEAEYGVVESGLFGVDGLSLGVGPAISYTQGKESYNYGWGDYGYKCSSILVGAKGYFHYDLFNVDKLDTYASITLGYNIASTKYFGDWGNADTAVSAGGLFYGFSVGARYWFTDAIGANLEAGVGLSFLKAGVTFKL